MTFDTHGPGGVCLIHGVFDGYRCADCLAVERARAARPSLLDRIMAWLRR